MSEITKEDAYLRFNKELMKTVRVVAAVIKTVNENGEPIHIHVSKGKPSNNSTKFWIKRDGIVLEHNKGNIPKSDLKKIQKYICANRAQIVNRWYEFFGF